MANTETERLAERNLAMWNDYISTGINQTDLGAKYGLSQSQVSEVLRKVREGLTEDAREDWRALAIQTVRELHNVTMELVRAPLPPSFHQGEVLRDERGNPVRDVSARLAATDRALKVHERAARLLGLDEPDRFQAEQTVHYTINGVDPEVLR